MLSHVMCGGFVCVSTVAFPSGSSGDPRILNGPVGVVPSPFAGVNVRTK